MRDQTWSVWPDVEKGDQTKCDQEWQDIKSVNRIDQVWPDLNREDQVRPDVSDVTRCVNYGHVE